MRIFIVDDEQVSLFLAQRSLILNGIPEDRGNFTFSSVKEARYDNRSGL